MNIVPERPVNRLPGVSTFSAPQKTKEDLSERKN